MGGISERIRADIEGRIRAGALKPGTRLPIETALMAEYNCARMTVGRAMTQLAQSGLIERRRKAGSFVAQPRLQTAVLEIPDISGMIAARGAAYGFAQRSRAVRPSCAESAEAALLARGAVLALDGVHTENGINFAWEHRVIALAQVPEAAEADFSQTGPGTWLLAHVPWSEARHRIAAVAADAIVARALDVKKGTACLQVERWTWRAGAGVTFARQLFPGDRFDLVASFGPDGGR